MSDKYHRLVTFVVDICTPVLHKVFLSCAQNDKTVSQGFTTTHAYMVAKQHDVGILMKRKTIRRDQYNKIYPNVGNTDESEWDISLVSAIVLGLFSSSLPTTEVTHIRKIREVRNSLQHASGTARVSDVEYNTMWTDLKVATVALAKLAKDSAFEADTDEKIANALTNHMPSLTTTLRLWHQSQIQEQADLIKELTSNVDTLQQKVDGIEQSSSSTCDMLKRGSVICKDSTGKPSKRFKTVDTILERLKESFRRAMATDLYEDFSPPSEISDVRNKLRTNNRIVLTGCRGSAYFQTALYAVKDMKYNLDRCVRLTDASTWNHIDPDEVDMVLFKHPFGESALDKGKLRAMLDVFKSILDTTKDSSKRLDVITVSREDILKQAQHLIGRDHDLFDINVQLYKENNEENPEDLVTETLMLDTTEPTDQPLKNLLEMSETHFRRSPSTRCQDRIIYTAKSNIRMHKTVVLAGTSKLAIDSLVLALVTSYSPNQRLLLTNPDNLVHVQLTKISLLIIDSFTGKYKYDSTKTHKWFEAFDTLLALVQDGKLNIIITAESQAFKRCLEEYGNHELLQHVVEVNESDISSDVKQDTTNGDNQQAEDVGQIDIIRVFHSTPDSDATEGSAILSNTTPMHINDIELTGVISGLTVVDDEYLVTSSVYPDSNGSTLTCISQKTLLKVSNLSIGHRVSGITTVDRNRVAVALRFAGVIMFIGISNKGHLSILAADELRVDKRCYGIVSGQNNRYLMASYIDSVENSNASFVEQMDTKGTVLNTFRTDSTGRPFNEPFALTLSGHNACTYVSDFGNNTLSALMENGDVAAVTSVDRPTDVAAGADGCVYVCCPNYNTVLQWSPQSGTLITLLDERNGVKEPECVTFCTQSRKLYVGMANVAVSKIKVYQMRNNPR